MIWQIFLVSIGFLLKYNQAATNVGGRLANNTVWTSTGSPYRLVKDVQVPRAITLTIQQGVRVDFSQGDFEILVKGFLQIKGTSAKQVIFEGGLATDQKSMIKFQSTNLSLSSISYTKFNGPKSALIIAKAADGLVQNSKTLSVLSSSFLHNTQIKIEGNSSIAPLELKSCVLNETILTNTFGGNGAIRITSSTLFYTTFQPKCNRDCIYINNCMLKHSIIEYNDGSESNGFTLYNSNAFNTTVISFYFSNQHSVLLTIKKSIINDFKSLSISTYGIVRLSQSNITFEDSSIFNLTIGGSYSIYFQYAYYSLQSNFAIRRCNVTLGNIVVYDSSNRTQISVIDSILTKVSLRDLYPRDILYTGNAILYMRNVSFLDANITSNLRTVDIAYSSMTLTTPFVAAEDSKISCSSIGRSGLVKQASSVGIIALSLTITNSTIKNFGTGIQAAAQGFNKITITKNNFIGNSLYNVANKGAYDINAAGNYWGTTGESVILNKIYDYLDDINYGDVLYKKYSTKALPAETGCPRYIKA